MKKFKSKTKYLVAISVAMLLCAGIVVAIPNSNNSNNRASLRTVSWSDRECPPGEVPLCPLFSSIFHPHPNDCHWFFHCLEGVAYCKECPAELHWNADLWTCDYPYRAGCCPVVICDVSFQDASVNLSRSKSAQINNCLQHGVSLSECQRIADKTFRPERERLEAERARCRSEAGVKP